MSEHTCDTPTAMGMGQFGLCALPRGHSGAHSAHSRSPRSQLSVHFSSATGVWATPWALFREFDREFGFTVDVCANADNAKCERFFSPEVDGVAQDWSGEVCWMNPPYGRELPRWMGKAADEARRGATVACLVPARTDTAWWHDLVWDARRHQPREGVEVRLLRGRIRFGNTAGDSAPFPSALVVFRPVASVTRAA